MKYPGGYQIIDLGDLSKVTNDVDTTLVIPGIHKRIEESKKTRSFDGVGKN